MSGSWRDVVTIHPAADLFPMLGDAELRELGEDINRHGLREKIKIVVRDKEQILIDGRNRLAAMELAGLPIFWDPISGENCSAGEGAEVDPVIVEVLDGHWHGHIETDDEIAAYIISVNIKRRHLTGEQKRELTSKVLKLDPSKSNRQIAAVVGVDHKTVGVVRKEAEATGEVPQLSKTRGKDGKERTTAPARREELAPEAQVANINQRTIDRQLKALMTAWDGAGPEARAQFLAQIDAACLDRRPQQEKAAPQAGALVWTESESRNAGLAKGNGADWKEYNAELADGRSYSITAALNFPSMTFGGYSVSCFDLGRKKGDRNVELGDASTVEKAKRIAQRHADQAKAEALH
jgi:hypothetical protein